MADRNPIPRLTSKFIWVSCSLSNLVQQEAVRASEQWLGHQTTWSRMPHPGLPLLLEHFPQSVLATKIPALVSWSTAKTAHFVHGAPLRGMISIQISQLTKQGDGGRRIKWRSSVSTRAQACCGACVFACLKLPGHMGKLSRYVLSLCASC